jgi:hypothetical protein
MRLGGTLPTGPGDIDLPKSTRSRGIKQGVFLMLMGVVLFPLVGILVAFGLGMRNPWPAGVLLFLLFGAGLLRLVYALMFEGRAIRGQMLPSESAYTSISKPSTGTPTAQLNASTIEPIEFVPASWRDDDDLEPASVTEETTHLLDKSAK